MIILLVLYGCLLLSGAYFGLKAGSKISMAMGILSGWLVLYGANLAAKDPGAGYMLISAISSLLSAVFLMRLIKTKKIMPSGMLLGASAIILILSLIQLST